MRPGTVVRVLLPLFLTVPLGLGMMSSPAQAAAESACTPPGITVLTDPSGDALDKQDSHDIQKVSVAEPFAGQGVSQLVFTIKVASLSSVPPDTTWREFFASADSKGYFVQMSTLDPSTVNFSYGTVPINSDGTYGTATTVGAADAKSNFKADGTITIIVGNDKVGNPAAGQSLTKFLVRVRAELGPAGAATPDNAPDDVTMPSGQYTLVGNDSCNPAGGSNKAPTAVLTAKPTSGKAPLAVAFNAKKSTDPDAGDSITSYTFTFGDGTSKTKTFPHAGHKYKKAGTYKASLVVTDSHGAKSKAVKVTITVK
jgi:hypothetical protein